MPQRDPVDTFVNEMKLLLRSYPDLQLEDLARVITPPSLPDAGWDATITPILRCAAAFGDSGNFRSKKEALGILQDELNLTGNTSNLRWDQIPAAAAWALLPLGPERASALLKKYRLARPPAPRKAEPRKRIQNTAETAAGIINARDT